MRPVRSDRRGRACPGLVPSLADAAAVTREGEGAPYGPMPTATTHKRFCSMEVSTPGPGRGRARNNADVRLGAVRADVGDALVASRPGEPALKRLRGEGDRKGRPYVAFVADAV